MSPFIGIFLFMYYTDGKRGLKIAGIATLLAVVIMVVVYIGVYLMQNKL